MAAEPVFSNESLAKPGQRDELAGMIYGSLDEAKAGLASEQEKLRAWNINNAAHNFYTYDEAQADLPVSERSDDYVYPADLSIFGGYVGRNDSNDD